jgi:formate hydrogenlyase transcriptional activator
MWTSVETIRRELPPFQARDGNGRTAPSPTDTLSLLHVAFEGAPHGVVVSAQDGTIRFVNKQAASIFGYPASELIGEPVSRLFPQPSPTSADDEWTDFWKHSQNRPAIAGRTVAGIRRDGDMVPLEIGLSLLADGSTRHVVASIRDISERLTLEARLAAATNAHLGFQKLVADVAARFGAVAPEGVDEAMTDSLRQTGEALQLDWAILWRKNNGEPIAVATHQWVHPTCPPPAESVRISSLPSVLEQLEAGDACCVSTVTDLPEIDREAFNRCGLRSVALVPLPSTGEEGVLMALALGSTTREQAWAPEIVERLRLVAGVVAQAFARRASQLALQKALDEIRRLRERLTSENVELRREVKVLRTPHPMVSESPAIQQVLSLIEQVAPTPATVLLLGETGAGKEVIAQAIHDLSPRHARQMIRVSCAAIPMALIESELFGRERGAYTGALSRQIGRFEAANNSTLFLDEIGELPMEVQVKLLRVLQDHVLERLGSTQPIKVDVRIIAATNRNLEDAVHDKSFREDLFYRLNVFPVTVPPLRERVDDIPALVWSFIDEFSRAFGKTVESISKDSMRELQRYPWPGNVRELRNVIERAVIVTTGRQLVVRPPRLGERTVPQSAMTLSELEVEHIRAVLEQTHWRVRGTGGAAERLGLKPTTLESRMARLGIMRNKAS